MRSTVLSLLVIGTACGAGLQAAAADQAATVLRNGKIFTMDPAKPWAQAVAIEAGKIVAVGSDNDIKRYIGAGAQLIDLGGRFAMPGLNDVHVHVQGAARDLAVYNCPFSQYSTFDQVLEAVRTCAAGMKSGEWVIGTYWNSKLYGRLQQADAIKELDAVSGDHPVILRNDTIHDRWVNSKALALAGITRETANPPNGVIGRDPKTGELNGLLIEGPAVQLVEKVSQLGAAVSDEKRLQQLGFGLRALNSLGVTGFQDAAVSPKDVELFKAADGAGTLNAHVSLCIRFDPNVPGDVGSIYSAARSLQTDHVKADCAKLFLDGVMVSRTAIFVEPYLPDEKHGRDFRGDPKTTQAQLDEVVADLDRRGVSVKFHAAGDGSVHQAVNAVEVARKRNGDTGPIHTIAHGGYVLDSDLSRLKTLRIAPDASPTVWYPGPILDGTVAAIGRERAYRYWPVKTMVNAGLLVAGGTDWKTLPDEFCELWDGIEGMITRRNPTGKVEGVLDAEQAVDVATALRIYTLNTAKALRIDGVTGSLEVGKSADVAVLDRNPFEIKPEDISETQVLMTFFEGRLVHGANHSAAERPSSAPASAH